MPAHNTLSTEANCVIIYILDGDDRVCPPLQLMIPTAALR